MQNIDTSYLQWSSTLKKHFFRLFFKESNFPESKMRKKENRIKHTKKPQMYKKLNKIKLVEFCFANNYLK